MTSTMRRISISPLLVLALACHRSDSTANPSTTPSYAISAETTALRYPDTQRVDHVDEYHGVQVVDPYRWLEDIDSAQTRSWIEAQNDLTFGYLAEIEARKALRERLTELWDFDRWSEFERHGQRYVARLARGLADQPALYVLDSPTAEPRLVLDPNTLSDDGTVALADHVVSPDGKLVAYGTQAAGSDWTVWRVRDLASGQDLPDVLEWIKFNQPAWAPDSSGFYYARYEAPKPGDEFEAVNERQRVFFHALGQPQSADTLVYERPDKPRWGYETEVTDDGRYLVITVEEGTDPKTAVFVRDLKASAKATAAPLRSLVPEFAARFELIGNQGSTFWFLTDDGAPRGRLLAIDVTAPEREHWVELIGEQAATLEHVEAVDGRFVAQYLDRARSALELFELNGTFVQDVELPGIGSVADLDGTLAHDETFFAFSSFAVPPTIYRLDPKTGAIAPVRTPEIHFEPERFVTEQVEYGSADGTKIPMFITRRADVKLDGNAPTYLYGYGGFGISLTPRFSVPNLLWLELGGVYAVPNLRGGGEFGESWHQQGTKLDKQNVFDDFIAAAQWLIDHGVTNRERLAIGGRSNGGLLVGAAITQRPDLFAAALPGVGVMDMLRFNKFTIGWAWESDYGSPEDPKQFEALFSYSPYHNVEKGTDYPATLVYTADHDDRVVPAHSYKFAAALQHAQADDDPVLIRIDTKAGHGAGKPTSKKIEEWTDLWGFVVDALDMDVTQLQR